MGSLTCEDCGKVFTQRQNLHRHRKTHTDIKYACDQCSATFKSDRCLLQHRTAVHILTKFCCDKCSKEFTSQGNLTRHKKTHNDELAGLCCEYCEKRFVRPDH